MEPVGISENKCQTRFKGLIADKRQSLCFLYFYVSFYCSYYVKDVLKHERIKCTQKNKEKQENAKKSIARHSKA